MTTNCIIFNDDNFETAKDTGCITTLTFDLDITLMVRVYAFNANLGKAAIQDDVSWQAIIPRGPKDAI